MSFHFLSYLFPLNSLYIYIYIYIYIYKTVEPVPKKQNLGFGFYTIQIQTKLSLFSSIKETRNLNGLKRFSRKKIQKDMGYIWV
jgi:hypothetical protein